MRITQSSADHFLGVVFNEETHGDLCFSLFCRRYTLNKLQSRTTRSTCRPPLIREVETYSRYKSPRGWIMLGGETGGRFTGGFSYGCSGSIPSARTASGGPGPGALSPSHGSRPSEPRGLPRGGGYSGASSLTTRFFWKGDRRYMGGQSGC